MHAFPASMARVGSGFFLVIQMVILLDFVQTWNDSWVSAGEEDNSWLYALLALTISAYGAVITMAALMFHWFSPSGVDGGCGFNTTLITLSLLLCLTFAFISLHPISSTGSIFPAAIVGLYTMYLCFSALEVRSEQVAAAQQLPLLAAATPLNPSLTPAVRAQGLYLQPPGPADHRRLRHYTCFRHVGNAGVSSVRSF